MKALLITAAALAWMGCKSEAKSDYRNGEYASKSLIDENRDKGRSEAWGTGHEPSRGVGGAGEDIQRETRQTGRDVGEEARQTGRDVSEGAKKSTDKVREESRQTSRDVGEGLEKAGHKTREEARQTARDIGEALKHDMAKTDADHQINYRIREAISNDDAVAGQGHRITLDTRDGVVEIKGTVESQRAMDIIIGIANDVAGKQSVDSDMKVSERKTGSDKSGG